ncbi:16575_t:CDS:2, partial [Acaulospora colombiana]
EQTAKQATSNDPKERALREKVERMKKRKEEDDARWKSGSQWRWEIISGRAGQTRKEGEEKWKTAMEGHSYWREEKGESDSQMQCRWERGVFLAGRLQDGDAFMSDDEDENGQGPSKPRKKNRDPEHLKALDTQHWLELVDPQGETSGPRLGYSIIYLASTIIKSGWRKIRVITFSDGQSFPSERLDYRLTRPKQRLNYLVKIDPDGKLRWDHNGQYVDTSPGKWRDAGEGKGILPIDESNEPISAPPVNRTRSDSSSSSSSEEELQAAQHYQEDLEGQVYYKGSHGETIEEDGTEEYMGICLVTSAGLIKSKYRTSIDHYRQFLDAMKDRGLDLHRSRTLESLYQVYERDDEEGQEG